KLRNRRVVILHYAPSESLELVLERCLDAVVVADRAVVVLAEAVEVLHADSHPRQRQPDEVSADVLGRLVGRGRQRAGQVAVVHAEREDRGPLLAPPLFVGREPAIARDQAESVGRVEGGVEAQAIDVLDVAVDAVAGGELAEDRGGRRGRGAVAARGRAAQQRPGVQRGGDASAVTNGADLIAGRALVGELARDAGKLSVAVRADVANVPGQVRDVLNV